MRLGGWVDRRRDLGGIVFIDLRDRAGIVQLAVEADRCLFAPASGLRPRPLVVVEDADPLAESPGPETCCEQQELARHVSEAVFELPESLRVVLVLRHYQGMSFEHMARMLGTPASTLKSPARLPVSGASRFVPSFEQASTSNAERVGQCR